MSSFCVDAITVDSIFLFLSFFSFSRPVLELFVTADEDGKLTLRGTYNYPGFNNMACYDSGRTKKEVEKLLAGLA